MPVLEIQELNKWFTSRDRHGEPLHVVKDVSLSIEAGETVAVIGESGSGKSTLGRLALRLLEADSGIVRFEGTDLASLSEPELRAMRKSMQVVFQEPYQSLNPRLTVGAIVGEPLDIHQPSLGTTERRRLVLNALDMVGLPEGIAARLPAELSGGQQQRVGIARALISDPRLVVLDEPTSSLDLTVRAQVLKLLRDLQSRLGLAYLFVSHDMDTVEWISDRTMVMFRGSIVETGTTEQILLQPQHAYTQKLLSARLSIDPRDRPGLRRATQGDKQW